MATAHQKIELSAQPRTVTGRKVQHLRSEGLVPAVLYGKGQEPLNLQIPDKDFLKVLKQAGESTLVYLNLEGQTYPTIIHDVTRDPIQDNVIHADFYKVRLDEKIKTSVSVVFTGTSPAVTELKAIFVRNVNELEVEALPQDLPHEISVDIASLAQFGDQILAKDVKLPSGVTLVAKDEEIIATVQEPISEEELKASLEAPTTDVSAVGEVEKEKKAEDEVEGEEVPAAGTAESAPSADTAAKEPKKPAKPEKK